LIGISPEQGKPRIYEIAKEFGIESNAVMAKLQAMGEFVISASSTVEPDALRQLWEHFEGTSQAATRDDSTKTYDASGGKQTHQAK
jgi:translation initiation factor IF-2